MIAASGIYHKDQSTTTLVVPPSSTNSSRIVLGSCHSQHYTNNTIWDAMRQRNASAMVWVGDAIYGDDFHQLLPPNRTTTGTTTTKIWWWWMTNVWKKRTIVRPATPTILQELYDTLIDDPGYRRLTRRNRISANNDDNTNKMTNSKTPTMDDDANDGNGQTVYNNNDTMTVLGIWDDHDYGVNNGDQDYLYRTESAQLYIQFLQRSSSSSRNSNSHASYSLDLRYMEQRAAAGKGLYGVKVLDFYQPFGQELLSDDEAGIEPDVLTIQDGVTKQQKQLSDRSVAIFLIDCRSNKTPWNTQFPNKYRLNYTADFLGEEQWQWLESSLRRSTATVNLIVQGLQVHADHFFDGNLVEDWSRFPAAQHRLYQTILSSGVSAPILVSGDVHMAELLRRDCRQRQPKHSDSTIGATTTHSTYGASRMLLEVTLSGMTHSWCYNTCARPHLGKICRNRWIQQALCAGMHLAHHTPAWTDVIYDRVNVPTTSKTDSHTSTSTKHQLHYVLERNFGEMEFDWDHRQVLVRVLGYTGIELLNTAWSFDLLSGVVEPTPTGKLRESDFEVTYQNLLLHNVSHNPDDWICLNHRGISSFGMKLFGVVSPICLVSFLVILPLNVLLIVVVWMINRHKTHRIKIKKLKQQ